MKLGIDTAELRRASRDMQDMAKQTAFAHVVALTRTAVALKAVEQAEMRRVFDRPSPFTLNSLYVTSATKSVPEASIGIKDGTGATGRQVPASKYLAAEIDAGQRRQKGFERTLQRNGLMPSGFFALPGRDAQLDAYGNVARRQIQQILSQLSVADTVAPVRALRKGDDKTSAGLRARAISRAGGQYVVLLERRGKLQPGIYQRSGAKLRSIIVYGRRATYRERFDFHGVAEKAAPEIFEQKLDEALAQYVK